MRKDYLKKLEKKGWNEREIEKAESVLEKTKEHDAHFSRIVFYSALLVIIFANLIASFAVFFLAIAISSWLLYIVIAVLAGTIGFLYNFLITDIGHLEKKHHVLAGIIIPIIALANFLLITIVANNFIINIGINNIQHNEWVIGAVFAVAFLLPTIIDKIFFNKTR